MAGGPGCIYSSVMGGHLEEKARSACGRDPLPDVGRRAPLVPISSGPAADGVMWAEQRGDSVYRVDVPPLRGGALKEPELGSFLVKLPDRLTSSPVGF